MIFPIPILMPLIGTIGGGLSRRGKFDVFEAFFRMVVVPFACIFFPAAFVTIGTLAFCGLFLDMRIQDIDDVVVWPARVGFALCLLTLAVQLPRWAWRCAKAKLKRRQKTEIK